MNQHTISLIVAMNHQRVIGNNNQLIWSLPNDLKLFRSITSEHAIVMGRKTFESIGRALPNRLNIIITRQKGYHPDNTQSVASLHDAIHLAKEKATNPEIFIIGGGEIYQEALPLAKKLYITLVDNTLNGDTFFPATLENLQANHWTITQQQRQEKDTKHQYNYTFYQLQRDLEGTALLD